MQTNETKCWLLWERFNRANGQVRYLRAVDTSKEQNELHIKAIQQERNHGILEVEDGLLDHLFGHSLMMVAGSVRKYIDGD